MEPEEEGNLQFVELGRQFLKVAWAEVSPLGLGEQWSLSEARDPFGLSEHRDYLSCRRRQAEWLLRY